MTLRFNSVLEAVEVHVHAKFHPATCSSSWFILLSQNKKLRWKQYSPSLPGGQQEI